MQAAVKSLEEVKKILSDLPFAHMNTDGSVSVPITNNSWRRVVGVLGLTGCDALCRFMGQLCEAGATTETEEGVDFAVLPDPVLKKLVPGITLL